MPPVPMMPHFSFLLMLYLHVLPVASIHNA